MGPQARHPPSKARNLGCYMQTEWTSWCCEAMGLLLIPWPKQCPSLPPSYRCLADMFMQYICHVPRNYGNRSGSSLKGQGKIIQTLFIRMFGWDPVTYVTTYVNPQYCIIYMLTLTPNHCFVLSFLSLLWSMYWNNTQWERVFSLYIFVAEITQAHFLFNAYKVSRRNWILIAIHIVHSFI